MFSCGNEDCEVQMNCKECRMMVGLYIGRKWGGAWCIKILTCSASLYVMWTYIGLCVCGQDQGLVSWKAYAWRFYFENLKISFIDSLLWFEFDIAYKAKIFMSLAGILCRTLILYNRMLYKPFQIHCSRILSSVF